MKKHHPAVIGILLAFAAFVKALVSLRYKVTIKGTEALKDSSPVLILPSHPALIDPIIVLSHIYRDTHAIPVISSIFYDIPILKSIFKGLGAVRVSNLDGGSRNTNVLNEITRSVLKGFIRGNSVVLYPSGQLSAQGCEKIFNKKSAQKIVSKIPEGVTVIGIRTTGLWGSMWSKAKTGKTPHFLIQMLKGLAYLLVNFIFFLPRRKVTIEIEDLTEVAKEHAHLGRKPFNLFLEEFYNVHGEEDASFISYFFFGGK
jgi:1-acyl-sn-glycerol-3-phosphate acyltransferase